MRVPLPPPVGSRGLGRGPVQSPALAGGRRALERNRDRHHVPKARRGRPARKRASLPDALSDHHVRRGVPGPGREDRHGEFLRRADSRRGRARCSRSDFPRPALAVHLRGRLAGRGRRSSRECRLAHGQTRERRRHGSLEPGPWRARLAPRERGTGAQAGRIATLTGLGDFRGNHGAQEGRGERRPSQHRAQGGAGMAAADLRGLARRRVPE